MDLTTPVEIRARLQKLWERGLILAAPLSGEALFPLSIRLRRPDGRALGERFDEIRKWIRELEEGSKARRGFGYELAFAEIEHRQLGKNRIPSEAVVPTREDALRLIGKERKAARFEALVDKTFATFPELGAWVKKRPLVLLDEEDDWERMLGVLAWFREHPRPGIYLRQIDVPNVDTKFIESHKGLLGELLDCVLGDQIQPDAVGVRNFETRYGLLKKPALVRFRILDVRCRIGGLSDIATPLTQFANLALPVSRIFITENDINGLAFPEIPDSAVVFGLGYGLDSLGEIEWLRERSIYYWGDLDTHGFAMLDRLRASFPNAHSLLMDRKTLFAHRPMWVEEAVPHSGPLSRLTEEERDLFEDLVANRFGERIRLEQERIGFGWVERHIHDVCRES